MKTLDEGIKAMDMCINDNDAQNCLGCPYADSDGEAACYGDDREDALYYLKEYRTILPLIPHAVNTAMENQKKGKTIG